MRKAEVNDLLRKEQDILDRLENVKRLIQMDYTLRTVSGCEQYGSYREWHRGDEKAIGQPLIRELDDTIELQLFSIIRLCNGDGSDCGEPMPMLTWNMNYNGEHNKHPSDAMWALMQECFVWDA